VYKRQVQGGAIYNAGILTITNSTFVDSGDGDVEGVSIFNAPLAGGSGGVTLQNTVIVSEDTTAECVEVGLTSITTIHSLVDDGTCAATLSGDPGLSDEIDNVAFGPIFSPLPGSVLINAGDDSVCPSDDASGLNRPQGLICDIGAVEFVDETAPEVTNVTLNNDNLTVCESLPDAYVQNVGLVFSEAMLGADDPMNYWITYAGQDQGFDDPFNADNIQLDFITAILSGTNDNPLVTLGLNQTLPNGLYRLEVSDGLTDVYSNEVNADNDFGYQFRIDNGNIFINSHYDNCGGVEINDFWLYETSGPNGSKSNDAIFTPSDTDVQGSPVSGSVRIDTSDVSTTYEVSQCQNIQTVAPVTISSRFVLEEAGPLEARKGDTNIDLTYQCTTWAESDCMGQQLDLRSQGLQSVGNTANPTEIAIRINGLNPNAESIECTVQIQPNSESEFQVLLDAIRLVFEDLIFANGFEQE